MKQGFLSAFNTLMGRREELISNCHLAQIYLCDCKEIDSELIEQNREIVVVTELAKKEIYENARTILNQDDFNERNKGYIDRHRKATDRAAELEKEKCERKNKFLKLDVFIKDIASRPLLLEQFDEKIWIASIDKVEVSPDGSLLFIFKDGSTIVG